MASPGELWCTVRTIVQSEALVPIPDLSLHKDILGVLTVYKLVQLQTLVLIPDLSLHKDILGVLTV